MTVYSSEVERRKFRKIVFWCLVVIILGCHLVRVLPRDNWSLPYLGSGGATNGAMNVSIIQSLDDCRIAAGSAFMVPFEQCPKSWEAGCMTTGQTLRIALGLH